MGKFYVYRHIRLDKNEPFYIGIGTKKNEKDYNRAFSKRDRNRYWNNVISITKYNVEIIYESDDINEVKEKEIEFIALYGRKQDGGKLCNMCTGGNRSDGLKGVPKTERFKRLLGLRSIGNKYNKGKRHSAETRNKLSMAHKKKYEGLTDIEKSEIFKKMGALKRGVKHTKSATYTDKWFRKKESEKIKVNKCDANGNILDTYSSLTEASIRNNCSISKISNCCHGIRKTHKGFIWKFAK